MTRDRRIDLTCPSDTMLQNLLQELPPAGSYWPNWRRELWLRAAEAAMAWTYGEPEDFAPRPAPPLDLVTAD